MATNLNVFCGQFSCPASGTTQSITAPGFQPDVVIFICSSSLSGASVIQPPEPSSSSTEAVFGMGFSDGTVHRLVAWGGDGGVSTSASAVNSDVFHCVIDATDAHQASTNSVTSPISATIAMTATGFDVTWNSAPGSGGVLNYIALGGSDLANVAIGTGTMPTTTGNSAITGLGFQPKFVMFISGSRQDSTSAVGAHFSYGCAISSSARFAHTLGVQDGQTMSASVNGVSYHSATACLAGVTSGAALEYLADFVSMDSGGFTLNFSTAPATAYTYYYLALGGSNLKVDINTATRPTTATTQSRTGLSFKPDVAWWSNSDLTTLATITSNAISLLGASDGTNTHSLYATHNDAISTVAGTNAVAKAAQDGAPANSSVTASFTSFNSDGWTITWGGTGAANQISSVSLAGTAIAFVADEDFGNLAWPTSSDPITTVWQ